jgi:hypothetical protein
VTQTYLPQTTIAAAQARSNQQALALGCDGMRTKYWWPIIQYASPDETGNMAALVITPGTPFDVTTTNAIVPQPVGLAAHEQAQVQPAAQVAKLLPAPASIGAPASTPTPVPTPVPTPTPNPVPKPTPTPPAQVLPSAKT